MIQIPIDDSAHPEGCACSRIEVLKVERDSITIKHHDISPCTLPKEGK